MLEIVLKLFLNTLNYFGKIQKTPFLAPKIVTMILTQGKKLTLNLDFRVHMLNFWAKKTPKKIGFLSTKSMPLLLLNNSKKKIQKVAKIWP